MQTLLKFDGAACSDVVSLRGQSYGSSIIRLGLFTRIVSWKRWKVRSWFFTGSLAWNVILIIVSSIRAWRGLRRNEDYAAKLERNLTRQRDLIEAHSRAKNVKKSNPFSVCSYFMPQSLVNHLADEQSLSS
jgi:hypothetical protein